MRRGPSTIIASHDGNEGTQLAMGVTDRGYDQVTDRDPLGRLLVFVVFVDRLSQRGRSVTRIRRFPR